VEYQLRHFRIRPGNMDAFLDAWLRGVYPLRRKFGFTFAGAWVVEGADEFVWIIGYDGPRASLPRIGVITNRPSASAYRPTLPSTSRRR
jgi:hypothetical protein